MPPQAPQMVELVTLALSGHSQVLWPSPPQFRHFSMFSFSVPLRTCRVRVRVRVRVMTCRSCMWAARRATILGPSGSSTWWQGGCDGDGCDGDGCDGDGCGKVVVRWWWWYGGGKVVARWLGGGGKLVMVVLIKWWW